MDPAKTFDKWRNLRKNVAKSVKNLLGGGNHLLHLLAGITSKCNLTDLGDGSSVSRDVQMKRTGVNIHFEEGPTVR